MKLMAYNFGNIFVGFSIFMLTSNGCDLKTFPNLLKAVKINNRAIKAEKISFVNFVTCFTNVDP